MEKEVKDFLDSILAKNTRKTYTRALEVFEEFMGQTISEIIEQRRKDFKSEDITARRELDRKVERFYVWLINEQNLAQNTAYSYITAIKSIMSYYDISLKLKGIGRVPSAPSDWVPSIDELRQIYEVGDLREKILLALATNIPMRVNDFNELLKSDILPLLNSTEFPVSFIKVTKKTKTPMPCFITEEIMNLLRKYVKTLRDENPYLWQGRGKAKLDEDSINRMLKNLVEKADIDTRGLRVRFHMFRKIFIGVARSMIGLSDDQVKLLTGKRVKGDMFPYYVKVELKPLFEKVAEKLRLTGYAGRNNKRLDSLEEVMEVTNEALAELLRPIVERIWLQRQSSRGDTLGLMTIPNFKEMEPKELLKEFLKLTREMRN